MKLSLSRKLNIKQRPLPQWLTYFVFVMPFLVETLQGFLGLPSIIKYSIDVAWLLATGLLFIRRKITIDKKMIPFFVFVGVFVLYTVLIYLYNFQSPFYYLWGFRNNFRVYFAFILYIMFFYEEDADKCLRLMDGLFYVNAAVSFVQFFVMGYRQDYLGGIFGVERGCNAYSLIFFSIVTAKSILQFMNKQEKFILCALKCTLALVVAAMAELKFFFVVFMAILIMSTLLTAFTWRKFFLILALAFVIMFAGSLLTDIFGEKNAITFERIIEFATTESYATEEDLSRFSAIPTISNSIMTSLDQRLFGLGLGNCDTSSFDICNTPFFAANAELHYTWFSSAFLFLETGYIGLSVYLLFFVMCFVFSFNMRRRPDVNNLYCQMAIIMSVLCIMVTFYNSSLRTEIAYMAYFILALPMISAKADIQYKRRLNVHT